MLDDFQHEGVCCRTFVFNNKTDFLLEKSKVMQMNRSAMNGSGSTFPCPKEGV